MRGKECLMFTLSLWSRLKAKSEFKVKFKFQNILSANSKLLKY